MLRQLYPPAHTVARRRLSSQRHELSAHLGQLRRSDPTLTGSHASPHFHLIGQDNVRRRAAGAISNGQPLIRVGRATADHAGSAVVAGRPVPTAVRCPTCSCPVCGSNCNRRCHYGLDVVARRMERVDDDPPVLLAQIDRLIETHLRGLQDGSRDAQGGRYCGWLGRRRLDHVARHRV
jgi:hypothetical protein